MKSEPLWFRPLSDAEADAPSEEDHSDGAEGQDRVDAVADQGELSVLPVLTFAHDSVENRRRIRNVKAMKTALEATVRMENAVAGAQDWFKRGVQIFQGELNAIGDAKRSLQGMVAKLTGEKPAEDFATLPPARHPQPRPLPAHLLKFPAFSPAPFHSLAHPTSATPPGAPSHHPSPCRFAPFSPASAVIVVVDKKQLPG